MGSGTAPLSLERLCAAASLPGGLWTDITCYEETASTNQDALAQARDGAAEGLVIAAETQTAGRGRQGRSWHSLPGAALTFSVLLRPESVPQARWGWVPLLAGVATATALRKVAAVEAALKWPNDVLADSGKLAGILAEQAGESIVVGIGINVLGGREDLPVATATSLELQGAGGTDRTELLAGILRELERWYVRWLSTGTGDADACGLRPEYLRLSATVGNRVRVELPGGRLLEGTASGVDAGGRLLVTSGGHLPTSGAGSAVAVSAGDVVHVRLSLVSRSG